MFYIKRAPYWPDPRVKPAFGTACVNWGHPLAEGLRACFLLNERAGYAGNLVGAPQATTIAAGGRNPWDAQGFIGDGTTVLGSRTSSPMVTGYPITLACEVSLGTAAVGTNPQWVGLDNPVNAHAYQFYYSQSQDRFWFNVTDGGQFATGQFLSPIPGRLYKFAGVSRSASSHEFWRDGVMVSTNPATVTFPTITGLSLGCAFNSFAPTGGVPAAGRLLWAALWARALSPAEIGALAAAPFLYLQPIIRGAKRVFPAEGNTWFIYSR